MVKAKGINRGLAMKKKSDLIISYASRSISNNVNYNIAKIVLLNYIYVTRNDVERISRDRNTVNDTIYYDGIKNGLNLMEHYIKDKLDIQVELRKEIEGYYEEPYN